MRKSLIFGAAASALVLTACSSDDLVQAPVDSNAIGFAVTNGATSRAAQSYCNTNMPGEFRVSAQFNGENGFYFEGDLAKRNGSSTIYTTNPERWWPEDKALDFHAWANDDATYAFDAQQNKAQFVNFAPKATAADQFDLLYGVAMNQSRANGNVKLNFRHALSQIVFSARTEAKTYNVAVNSVAIGHLNNQGTFTYGGESTTENYENHNDFANGNEEVIKKGAGKWDLNGSLVSYTTSFGKKVLTNETAELTSVNHQGGADGSLLLLPQTQDAWVPRGAATDKDNDGFNGAYFLINVELTNDKDVVLYKGDMAVPVEISWEQGTRYRYTLVFTDGNGGFTPDPDDPQPVLGGIKYDVTTDDFVPVNGGEKDPGEDPRPDADKYSYTLNFDANGGEGVMEAAAFSNIAATSQVFQVPACTFTRTDYEFKGWNTQADGKGTAYVAGEDLIINGVAGQNASVTLYAQWESTMQTITLSFDTNGEGNIAAISKTVKKGESAVFAIPTVEVESTEYQFEGWLTRMPANKVIAYEDDAPEGLILPNQPNVKFSTNTTLYALYREASSGSAGGGTDKPFE